MSTVAERGEMSIGQELGEDAPTGQIARPLPCSADALR